MQMDLILFHILSHPVQVQIWIPGSLLIKKKGRKEDTWWQGVAKYISPLLWKLLVKFKGSQLWYRCGSMCMSVQVRCSGANFDRKAFFLYKQMKVVKLMSLYNRIPYSRQPHNKHLFFTILEVEKPTLKVLADTGSCGCHLPGLQVSEFWLFPHMDKRDGSLVPYL